MGSKCRFSQNKAHICLPYLLLCLFEPCKGEFSWEKPSKLPFSLLPCTLFSVAISLSNLSLRSWERVAIWPKWVEGERVRMLDEGDVGKESEVWEMASFVGVPNDRVGERSSGGKIQQKDQGRQTKVEVQANQGLNGRINYHSWATKLEHSERAFVYCRTKHVLNGKEPQRGFYIYLPYCLVGGKNGWKGKGGKEFF